MLVHQQKDRSYERLSQTRGLLDPERKAEWRGSGLLTRPQPDRNRRGPPFRTDDPSGKGHGLLNRRESFGGSSPPPSSKAPVPQLAEGVG